MLSALTEGTVYKTDKQAAAKQQYIFIMDHTTVQTANIHLRTRATLKCVLFLSP